MALDWRSHADGQAARGHTDRGSMRAGCTICARQNLPLAMAELAAKLDSFLKLRSIPFGMKLFKTRAEMETIPRIRRPKAVHTLDQVVAQAARLGWTVGVTAEDLVGAQCRAVVGLGRAKD